MEANTFAGHPEYFSGAITSTSRVANIFMGREQTKKILSLVGEEPKEVEYGLKTYMDLIVAGDTDSCFFSSVININNNKIQIGDFYETSKGTIEIRGKDNYIKHLTKNYITPSLNKETGKIEYKKVNYIMKHKVKKRMFKIKHKDNEVIVTEDHSIIIKRGKKYLDIKPKDIKKGDKIIKIQGI